MKLDTVNILIVDDDHITLSILESLLCNEGYATLKATSGLEAIEIVKENEPQLILLDINMPGINGYEVCRLLKANPTTAYIPIIFITADDDEDSICQSFEAGAQDYIHKPVRPIELLSRVTNQLKYLEHIQLTKLIHANDKKMSSLETMLTTVAHEVSSPFGNLKLSLSHLESSISGTQQALKHNSLKQRELESFLVDAFEAIHISHQNISQATAVLNSFKLIAIDQCKNTPSTIDLKKYLESILLSHKPKISEKLHKINLDIPKDINVTTLPGALSQVITNLINNSYLHGFENMSMGEINIVYNKNKDQHHIIYTDNGYGIQDIHLEKIFDKYFTTKEKTGGHGLGMAIVKKLIEEDMQGSISVFSKAQQGVEIRITLPLDFKV
jgi:DNA-binding response OmpR family regulator